VGRRLVAVTASRAFGRRRAALSLVSLVSLVSRASLAARASFALLLGAGCGVVLGLEPLEYDAPSAIDAGGDGPAPPDVSDAEAGATDAAVEASDADVVLCDLNKPFVDVALVPNVNSNGDESYATLTSEEDTILFTSTRGGTGHDIYMATRPTKADPFDAPIPMTDLSSPADDLALSLSADGLKVFLSSNRNESSFDIYAATRASRHSPFGKVSLLPAINTLADERSPYVTADGTLLYFATNRDGGSGGFDIWRAAFVAGVPTAPAVLGGVNSDVGDFQPVLSADGLVLYFASSRAALPARGNRDIWMATRSSPVDPFGAPTNVEELNTTAGEAPVWLSPDGCALYFSSDRPGGVGLDLYVARRAK
jgi:WD40 repeat protein